MKKRDLQFKSLLDFRFWILDFGFWILDFGFWILDFGFWILDFQSMCRLSSASTTIKSIGLSFTLPVLSTFYYAPFALYFRLKQVGEIFIIVMQLYDFFYDKTYLLKGFTLIKLGYPANNNPRLEPVYNNYPLQTTLQCLYIWLCL
jgi:hypothetical protein